MLPDSIDAKRRSPPPQISGFTNHAFKIHVLLPHIKSSKPSARVFIALEPTGFRNWIDLCLSGGINNLTSSIEQIHCPTIYAIIILPLYLNSSTTDSQRLQRRASPLHPTFAWCSHRVWGSKSLHIFLRLFPILAFLATSTSSATCSPCLLPHHWLRLGAAHIRPTRCTLGMEPGMLSEIHFYYQI